MDTQRCFGLRVLGARHLRTADYTPEVKTFPVFFSEEKFFSKKKVFFPKKKIFFLSNYSFFFQKSVFFYNFFCKTFHTSAIV